MHRIKMFAWLLTLVCAGACWANTDPSQENLELLMDNVVVLRVQDVPGSIAEVPLTCGEAHHDTPIIWKKNGEEFYPPLQGNRVRVEIMETDGGNYTCHLGSTGEYLNHTVILVRLDPDNKTVILEKTAEKGHIHCTASNYKGSFHCTWKKTKYRFHAKVLLVKAKRFMDTIPCQLDADGLGVHCQESSCPYKEEQHPISLTVYMQSVALLEGYATSFYLREIVRPAKLPNLRISEDREFMWDYPESWEKPCTYYGLQFQVKTMPSRHSCNSNNTIMTSTTNETNYKVNAKARSYVFCVRAQDRYTSGPWSEWSQCIANKNKVDC